MAYVYRHIRHDKNQVFYVGIGTDKKYKYTRAKSQNRNKYWKRIVAKTDYDVEILFDDVSKEFAIAKEIEFIELYGRRDLGKGTLCNLTDGGEGATNMSEEGKQRLREFRMNTPMSEKQKQHYSKLFKKGGNPNSQKVINKHTLEVFNSIIEASESSGLNKRTLGNNLNGKNCNRTDFYYYKDYLEKGLEQLEKERLEKIKKTKEELSLKRKNRKLSEEHKLKISKAGKGRKPSEKAIKALKKRNNEKNHMCKKVINKMTGEVFKSITSAAKSVDKNRVWLSRKLRGLDKNKTPFLYLSDYNRKEE